MVSTFIEREAKRALLAEQDLAGADLPELDRLADLIGWVFQVPHVAIAVGDGARLRIVAGLGLDDQRSCELEGILAHAAGTGFAPDNGEAAAAPCPLAASFGFVEAAPLTCGDRGALGALAIADEAPRQPSARGRGLLVKLAAIALDQVALLCLTRRLDAMATRRAGELQALRGQARALKERIAQICRLGRIGGWVLDVESGQLLWTEEPPATLGLPVEPAGGLLSLYEGPGREQLRRALSRTVAERRPLDVEHPIRVSDQQRWLRFRGELEPGAGTAGRVVGIVQDITALHRADARIQQLAHYDSLTGLPNRTLFTDRLEASLRWARRSGNRVAVLVADIDRFSEVNDARGYEGGDALLVAAAHALSAVVRACDTVARLAGDRFAVLVNGTDAAGDLMKLAERLMEAVAGAGEDAADATRLTASLGIALSPGDGGAAAKLLRAAEMALERAKAMGGGQYAFFTGEMAKIVERRRALMAEARAGLQAGQFVVAYQPKIDLRDDAVAGFEALIRWAHPQRGLLAPAAFWEALDDPALGRELSNAVLAQVAAQLAEWRRQDIGVACVAVNLCASQLRDPAFLGYLRELLQRFGLPPSSLKVEITESVLIGRGGDNVLRALKGIHEAGIETALDDFGTGYASLTHLRQLPVHRLKIDRSFVTGLLGRPDNETIVRALIEMAHGLGLELVAEGVESAEVDRRLRELGCDFGQGFLYGRPMPAERVPAFLGDWLATGAPRESLRLVGGSEQG